jgi:prepilin-type N-terminal cleavage/methylation domain-containing protein
MTRFRQRRPRAAKGFTIIELLIAIIIIGVIVAIAVPIIASRADQARIASAKSDLRNIAAAMDTVAIDTGYYPRMFLLDDALVGDGEPFQYPNNVNDRFDGIDEYVTIPGNFYQALDQLFIIPATGDLVAPAVGAQLLQDLQDDPQKFNWNGPFITWNLDRNLYTALGATIPEPDGLPDDPWGNNYLLFTKLGLMIEPEGELALNATFPDDRPPTNGGPIDCEVFGRFALVSLGPDGVPGSPPATDIPGEGDDLVYLFGP